MKKGVSGWQNNLWRCLLTMHTSPLFSKKIMIFISLITFATMLAIAKNYYYGDMCKMQ